MEQVRAAATLPIRVWTIINHNKCARIEFERLFDKKKSCNPPEVRAVLTNYMFIAVRASRRAMRLISPSEASAFDVYCVVATTI